MKVTDCTVWDNSNIFKSLDDPRIETILTEIASKTESLKVPAEKIANALEDLEARAETVLNTAQDLLLEQHNIAIEIYTIRTYASCITSTDAKNEQAKSLLSKISKLHTNLNKLVTPLFVYTDRISESVLEKFLDHPEVKNWHFQIKHGRLNSDFLLATSEEQIISGLATDGLHAWGNLYFAISGKLTCQIDEAEMGIAKASSLLRQGDRDKRIKAHKAINEAWEVHAESSAAILNAINGWRLENNSLRSKKRDLHYLDKACHQAHITRKTLDTLMQTTFENRSIGQRALKAMAKGMQLEQLGPWDILAPAPVKNGKVWGFRQAIDIIAEAFSRLTPQMGEFAQMMYRKNWIDAKETEFRATGAYCTGFSKYREPRVFMTYDGSMGNILTLAHELGHAYHNWVMRDMPFVKTFYAMTTAETASIFGETLVRDYLFENSKSDEEKFEIAWQDAESAGAMLCNIPARFEFEKNFVEKRKLSTVPVSEMKSMMGSAWKHWYEDSLSEYDEMYWASKLHFSISSMGFYNYPYLFGYLFSLGIYAEKDNHGDRFNDLYTQILRDTGSMNAVELIQKHLGKSIEEKEFWQGSLNLVEKAVARFEGLVKTLFVFIFAINFLSCSSARNISSVENESIVLREELEGIRAKFNLPSLAAVLVDKDKIVEIAATGKRAFDHPETVTVNDIYHLGSNTKSMTAMLFAKEVEKGSFAWESKVEDAFPSYSTHRRLKPVTLEALLRHKGGVTNNTIKSYPKLWQKFYKMQGVDKPIEQRVLLSKRVLNDEPLFKPNTKSNYSNVGVSLVGHAMELSSAKAYEELLRNDLFRALEMDSCGFGAPGSSTVVDQPRGHTIYDGKLYSVPPTATADNPDAVAPAGKVHCSLVDWGKYIKHHLKGALFGTKYLDKESFKKLHTPLKGDIYGLGWLKLKAPWDKKKEAIFHNGSNTMNYAEMWFSPDENIGIGVVTNIGNTDGQQGVREAVIKVLQARLK